MSFQQQVHFINTVMILLDAICIIVAGYVTVYLLEYFSNGFFAITSNTFVISVMGVMFLNTYIMGKLELYSETKIHSTYELIWSIVQAIAIDFIILFAAFAVLKLKYTRAYFLTFALFSLVFLLIQRIIAKISLQEMSTKDLHVRKILIIGNMERGKIVTDALTEQLSWGHEIIGKLEIDETKDIDGKSLGRITELPEILKAHTVDEVVFALDGNRSIDLFLYLTTCQQMGVQARILPALWKPDNPLVSVDRILNIPFLTMNVGISNITGLIYKRILDIMLGFIGFILLLILYPIVGAAIKLDSPGPIIFQQIRVGKNGRLFNLYKFRSMYQDAEDKKYLLIENNEMNGPMFKIEDDPRITRVGKFIRNTSIDEFPQFVNVIKGEMSIVGTRPPTPNEVSEYDFCQHKRISGKPGITGLWQISGRNKINEFETVVELDCKYLDDWRFIDDIVIILKTIYAVIRRKGAR